MDASANTDTDLAVHPIPAVPSNLTIFHFDIRLIQDYISVVLGNIPQILHYLRNITAVLLALFVASPLCCCAAFAKQASPTQSCCGSSAPNGSPDGEQQDKDPSACNCASKQPKDTAKAIIMPSDLATLAVPPSTDTMLPVGVPVVEAETVSAIPQDGYDPPGTLLLRYSRWLI